LILGCFGVILMTTSGAGAKNFCRWSAYPQWTVRLAVGRSDLSGSVDTLSARWVKYVVSIENVATVKAAWRLADVTSACSGNAGGIATVTPALVEAKAAFVIRQRLEL